MRGTGPIDGQPANVLRERLAHGRTLAMGILNITPDSFSDGGRFLDPSAALTQARRMIEDGADLIDVGAESTRPYGNAVPVSADDEIERLKPILPSVIKLGCPVSIDTMKPQVASYALDLGACVVNDVWGLQRDPQMAAVVARHDVPVIVMHNREQPDPAIDILADIESFFSRTLAIAERAGIKRNNIVLDPGIGFGKTPEQSIQTIARLDELKTFGLPLLVGLSRKRFISSIVRSEPGDRLGCSIAGNLFAAMNGADIVRTHDVRETVQALRVAEAIRRAR
jgi:dihydropteroate synthase